MMNPKIIMLFLVILRS